MINTITSRRLNITFFIIVFLKCLLIVFSDCNLSSSKKLLAAYPFQYSFNVNPDELDIGSIALNYNNGYGFAANVGYYARKDKQPTAWRTSFPVFLHILAQKAYHSIYPERHITLSYADPYFKGYAFGIQLLSVVAFAFSLYSFHIIAQLFLKNATWAYIATITYSFVPSVFYYIGNMTSYENLALPILIIVTSIVYQALAGKRMGSPAILICICLLASGATLLRPHVTLIFYALGAVILIAGAFYKRFHWRSKEIVYLCLVNGFLLLFIQIPVFWKNYKIFNHLIISNQAGFNFLLGHNEYARGSWLGNSEVGSEWDKYIANQIPNLEQMNEYEEAQARKQIAVTWIKENPSKEALLIVRKIAIFFLPDNYLHPKEINLGSIITGIIHLLFLIGFIHYCFSLVKTRFPLVLFEDVLPYLIVLISILFSILFFVDHRWRYYADPFMMLIAFKSLHDLASYKLNIHFKGSRILQDNSQL